MTDQRKLSKLNLNDGWQLKQREPGQALTEDFKSSAGWWSVAVPGTVHQALLEANLIPDPFEGRNEREVQWVGEADWLYRRDFEITPELLDAPSLDLCFDGLDTFATVWLNGQLLATSQNMFVPLRLNVKERVQAGSNRLEILFESALRRGRELEKQYGPKPVWNTDPSRVYVRKAQYHYGWDWGPVLITAGLWREVRLEAYQNRLVDLACPYEVSPALDHASLPVSLTLDTLARELKVELTLFDPTGQPVATTELEVGLSATLEHTFELNTPRLWWPRGYGEQAFYRLEAVLRTGDTELDRLEKRLGLRRLRLVQEPVGDEPGTSFYFEINNQGIFAGGANWIPADSFTPRITPARYDAWLDLAAQANLVMLRVWGGGIYEPSHFYERCDELGLLVWQDFMFGCALYPAHSEFLANVETEVEAVVKSLRHHPSLVLWCANNEDYSIAVENFAYDPHFEGDFTATPFAARQIYERLMPQLCTRLDPTRPYWRGSPYNEGRLGRAQQAVGDAHDWSVWHGMLDYQLYPAHQNRFISEFGMMGWPERRTLAEFAAPSELHPDSAILEFHNKAQGGTSRLAGYIAANLGNTVGRDLDSYIYATQFVQAEAMGYAYGGWRRRWGKPGQRRVGGALVWQLDDCWPALSWAIADYHLRPKGAYYIIKRKLASLTVEATQGDGQVEVWAVNGTLQSVTATLDLQFWTPDGQLIEHRQRPVELLANQVSELVQTELPTAQPCIISARLLHNDQVLARSTAWPEPFKHHQWPDPGLTLAWADSTTLRLSVERPAKGVWLAAPDLDGVTWNDNMLDLVPGDPQLITVSGLTSGASLEVRWLGQESLVALNQPLAFEPGKNGQSAGLHLSDLTRQA